MNIKDLIGKTIVKAEINDLKNRVVLSTNNEQFFLSWEGDCCAKCYLENVSGAEYLTNSTILDIKNSDWKNVSEDDYEVTESMGTLIKTDKGYVSFESRLEHNGYYGGWINISKETDDDDISSLSPLKDF